MIIVQPKVEVEPFDGLKIMKNIERACRTCYRSEGSITEDSYKRLIGNCLSRNHESVLEHEKITVRLTCDVGTYKDLTRHRIASFSIESTRYCNYSKDKFGKQLNLIQPVYLWALGNDEKSTIWTNCMKYIENCYMQMEELGAKPDELRMMLPHSTAAEVTMTANIREWRHIFNLRAQKAAHPAVRQLMIPLLLYFKKEMPELFNDINYDEEFPTEKYAEVTRMEDLYV